MLRPAIVPIVVERMTDFLFAHMGPYEAQSCHILGGDLLSLIVSEGEQLLLNLVRQVHTLWEVSCPHFRMRMSLCSGIASTTPHVQWADPLTQRRKVILP